MSDSLGYDKTRIFNFNLIPPKTQEELSVLVGRDNTTLYAFFLIFFGMLLYFSFSFAQSVLISPKIALADTSISSLDAQIAGFDSIKRANGELLIKSQALEPILLNDIKITQLLSLSANILNNFPSATIVNYSREGTGEFVLTFRIDDYSKAGVLLDIISKESGVSGAFMRSVSPGLINDGTVVISFTLSNTSNNSTNG